MGPATDILANPTFEDYLRAMDAYLKNVVRRQIRHHPYLEEDDLKQEAMKVLWDAWKKFGGTKPFEDVCKMGTNAMKQQMNIVWCRSRARGEGAASMLYLDSHVTYSSDTEFHETIEDKLNRPDVPIETRGEFYSYCSGLTEVETKILTEFLNPCDATVKAMEELITNRQRLDRKVVLVSVRNSAVAQSLKLSPAIVAAAWRKLQKVVSAFLEGRSKSAGYNEQEDDMETLVIDPSELPGDEDEVTVPAAKKPSLPAPKVKTPTPAPAPESVATPAAEPEIKAKRAYKKRDLTLVSNSNPEVVIPDNKQAKVFADVDESFRFIKASLSSMDARELFDLRRDMEHILVDINHEIAVSKS